MTSRGRLSPSRGWRRLLVLALTFSTGPACDLAYEAVFDPDAPKEGDLRRLVRDHAGEEELAKVMGPGARTHRKGSPDWAGVEEFLAREPRNSFGPLRDAMRDYPTLVYHTTAWRMTWVWLDSSGVVRGYYLCAQ